MKVYVVLYDRPVGYNGCYETEIVDIFKHPIHAKECERKNENYRIEEWVVKS